MRVSEATKELLGRWKEGVSLANDFASPIDDLVLRVAVARWRLAAEHLRDANLLFRSARPVYRSVISRYYYAMYHGFRAVRYISHGGDDFQSHSDLPPNLPDDLPQVSLWKTKLKDARLIRNRADYEAYPRSANIWRAAAIQLRAVATAAVAEAKAYLVKKGCKL